MVESTRTRVIKKYANRKLYDTHDRRYVTKDIVYELIGEGYDVQVVDKETGADITSAIVDIPAGRGRRNSGGSSSDAVRQQLVHALRGGLKLPIEVGARAMSRLERRAAAVDSQEFADLYARVEELSYEVQALRELIVGGESPRGL